MLTKTVWTVETDLIRCGQKWTETQARPPLTVILRKLALSLMKNGQRFSENHLNFSPPRNDLAIRLALLR